MGIYGAFACYPAVGRELRRVLESLSLTWLYESFSGRRDLLSLLARIGLRTRDIVNRLLQETSKEEIHLISQIVAIQST